MADFRNCQLIMIAELRERIEYLQKQGKEYKEIRAFIVDNYGKEHWLVTDQRGRDEAIAAALMAYAMTKEQRKAVLELKELTGLIIP